MPTCWAIPGLMVHIHGHDECMATLLATVAFAMVPSQWSLAWLHQMEGILGNPLELGPLGVVHTWVGIHPWHIAGCLSLDSSVSARATWQWLAHGNACELHYGIGGLA